MAKENVHITINTDILIAAEHKLFYNRIMHICFMCRLDLISSPKKERSCIKEMKCSISFALDVLVRRRDISDHEVCIVDDYIYIHIWENGYSPYNTEYVYHFETTLEEKVDEWISDSLQILHDDISAKAIEITNEIDQRYEINHYYYMKRFSKLI